MFTAHLNVFVAAWILLSLCIGPIISLVLMAPLALVGSLSGGLRSASMISYVLMLAPYVAIAIILVVVWIRVGLAPATRKPARERRYRIGQKLLLALNIAAFATFAGPMLVATIGGKAEYQYIGFLLIPFFGLALGAGIAGLYMVWSSRA
jgi:hypothetical protein